MNISFEYSPLWLLPALLAAAALVWWLYLSNRGSLDWSRTLRTSLATLRWITIALLAFLALRPFLTQWLTEQEKPILAIYQDVSESLNASDSAAIAAILGEGIEALEEKYEVHQLHVGDGIGKANDELGLLSPLFTDLGAIKDHLANRFYNQNVGAVVVATDGIQNKGADPRYLNDGHSAPYFLLALGDSALRADARIIEILNNKLVFLNNEFQVKVRLAMDETRDAEVPLAIWRDGKVVAETIVTPTTNRWVGEASFTIVGDEPGLHRYEVRLAPLEGEKNTANNSSDFYIDVLDNRTRVGLIASVPHPDVGAIKRAIEKVEQYEVTVGTANDWSYPAGGLDLAILHGFPGNTKDASIIQRLQRERVPIWYIASSSANMKQLSSFIEGFAIKARSAQMDQSGAMLNRNFNLFNAPAFDALNRLPPLSVPFGEIQMGFEHQALMNQRIGIVETDRPLWVFFEQNGAKSALMLGEGLWRWRMANVQLKGNSDWFDSMIAKTVQYLSVRQKRARLQVTAPRKVSEGTRIQFSAELYNESFELTNDAEVTFELNDADGRPFSYTFKPDGLGYGLSIGNLAAGEYTWSAATTVNGERFTESGTLMVTEVKAEQMVTRANHDFLRQWAAREGGLVFYAGEETALGQELLNLEQAKPRIISEKQWNELIEWKWLLAVLALLLSIEWFLRKYNGSY